MSDKRDDEFEKRKAEIEADKDSVDKSLEEGIDVMDNIAELPRVKDSPELKMLCQAHALTLTGLRRVNIETHSAELQLLILEHLYLNTSQMVKILASLVNRVSKPDEVNELRQKLSQYEPIMEELKKQIRQKSKEMKAIEKEEKDSRKRLERLTGATYG